MHIYPFHIMRRNSSKKVNNTNRSTSSTATKKRFESFSWVLHTTHTFSVAKLLLNVSHRLLFIAFSPQLRAFFYSLSKKSVGWSREIKYINRSCLNAFYHSSPGRWKEAEKLNAKNSSASQLFFLLSGSIFRRYSMIHRLSSSTCWLGRIHDKMPWKMMRKKVWD